VRTAASKGIECLGIRRGYNGLIHGDIQEMKPSDVNRIMTRGGTFLYTARCPEFQTDEGMEKARLNCKHWGIDGIVAVGGDGTFRGALDLSRRGVNMMCVPATIDNDIGCTNYSIGFDTACNTAIDAIDKLCDTMQSHQRCSVVEVMGHRAGHLACYVGIAVGAISVFVPERQDSYDSDVNELISKIRKAHVRGRTHFIVIVAEGVKKIDEVSRLIHDETGMEARVTTLGHVQRGGCPSVRDRVTASRMGRHAVLSFLQGNKNRVMGIIGGSIREFEIEEALQMKRDLQQDMVDTVWDLSQV
jgi:6-phosphofructokinase 1